MTQLNTKEKCTLRDLIKIEIKYLTKTGYGQYKYLEDEYCAFLLKLGRKLKLDIQQKIKAKKVYRWNIVKEQSATNTELKIVFVVRKAASLIKLDADNLFIMAREIFVL